MGEKLKVENAKNILPCIPAVELIFAYCHVNKRIVVFRIRVARYRRAHCQPYTLLPIVSGLSYEVIKYTARKQNVIVKIISYPGLMLQKLTTREPDESQLE